jgi:hypothetical protein
MNKKIYNPEDKTTISPRKFRKQLPKEEGSDHTVGCIEHEMTETCGPHHREEMSTRNFSRNN